MKKQRLTKEQRKAVSDYANAAAKTHDLRNPQEADKLRKLAAAPPRKMAKR